MDKEQKKQGIFSKITNRDDAEKMAKDAAMGFFVVAVFQGGAGFFILNQPSMLIDAGIWAILGLFIWKVHSRIAAGFAALMALISLYSTLINVINPGEGVGGSNMILMAVIVLIAARAVEATWRLNSEFKEQTTKTPETEIPAP